MLRAKVETTVDSVGKKAKIRHQRTDLPSLCACGRGDPGKAAVVGVGLKGSGGLMSVMETLQLTRHVHNLTSTNITSMSLTVILAIKCSYRTGTGGPKRQRMAGTDAPDSTDIDGYILPSSQIR